MLNCDKLNLLIVDDNEVLNLFFLQLMQFVMFYSVNNIGSYIRRCR